MGLFDNIKNKRMALHENAPVRDHYKDANYYIKHIERIDKCLSLFANKDPKERNHTYYVTVNNYLFQKLQILYVLYKDYSDIKTIASEYCDNLQHETVLVYNEISKALALAVLFDIDSTRLEFINSKMIDEKYVDAILDLLRNKVFNNKVQNTKEFYYKDKGYFGDGAKDTNGLMGAIKAIDDITRNKEFDNYLKKVKQKHYNRLLTHYDKVGEDRYVYTGSYDFRLTAIAKILDIDKGILEESIFIADDLI